MFAPYNYILPLNQVSRAISERTGMKAANLGELLQAGFKVPSGFVLTAEAFKRFHRLHGFSNGAPEADILAAPLPDDVLQELVHAYEEFGGMHVAVRSSGIAEDLPESSYAGQYETVLGVQGQSALQNAVTKCWSSAFSRRISAYRDHIISIELAPIAVLVQHLLAPRAAGVAFTANPVTGDRDEILVSAVRGLGDRLVSGSAQPDEWSVQAGSAICLHAPEEAVGSDDVLRVAALADQVRSHFQTEQDIEWAIADNELFLLQARPVTGLAWTPAQPNSIEIPDGFWQREITHYPRPTSVMIDGFLNAHNESFRRMCATYGLLIEGVEVRLIGGWAYTRVVPLGGKDMPLPPKWLMWLIARAMPRMRQRVKECQKAVQSDQHGRDIERWYDEWRPDLSERVHSLAAVDLQELSDAELAHHIKDLNDFAIKCLEIHFQLHGAMMLVMAEFLFACRDLLDWDDQRAFLLLNGLSYKSTEPSRALADLAEQASASPEIRSLIDDHEDVSAASVCAADPVFAKAFDDFVRHYGCRTVGMEFVEPTLAEQPDLLIRLIRHQVISGYNPQADAAAALAERERELKAARQLAGLRGNLDRFERTLARAERAYPVREDSEFFTASAPLGLGRLAALEVGRRLVERQQLSEVEDVFFLTMAEQQECLLAPIAALGYAFDDAIVTVARDLPQSIRDTVFSRQREQADALANPGPPSYGTEPKQVSDFSFLPRDARFTMEAMQAIMLDRILAPDASARVQSAGSRLSGIAASQGYCTGPVRVVMDESEFDKVEPGDILVCPITSPVWSVLFPSIAALITDTGGILSHAAIIAREYRLPAVVGTGNATNLLTDGDVVSVDGTSGTIHVHSFRE
jgi:rifampicin phosphotransferase